MVNRCPLVVSFWVLVVSFWWYKDPKALFRDIGMLPTGSHRMGPNKSSKQNSLAHS